MLLLKRTFIINTIIIFVCHLFQDLRKFYFSKMSHHHWLKAIFTVHEEKFHVPCCLLWCSCLSIQPTPTMWPWCTAAHWGSTGFRQTDWRRQLSRDCLVTSSHATPGSHHRVSSPERPLARLSSSRTVTSFRRFHSSTRKSATRTRGEPPKKICLNLKPFKSAYFFNFDMSYLAKTWATWSSGAAS